MKYVNNLCVRNYLFCCLKVIAQVALCLFITSTATAQTAREGKKISPDIFGLFFEDINYSADGGLYAELIQNRSFEYSPSDRSEWNPFSFWEYITPGFSYGSISVETKNSTLAASCIKDSRSGDIILKFANVGNKSKTLKINLSGFKSIIPDAEKTLLTGKADDENTFENSTNAIPQLSTYKVSPKFEYSVPAMSLTVLRVKNKSN